MMVVTFFRMTPQNLLDFYARKMSHFDKEQEDFLKEIQRLKVLIDKQFDLEDRLQQRENEISQLQDSLSDVQLMLYEEREHGLKLQAENDKFQIQALESRKKIDFLLALSGKTEEEVTYIMTKPPQSLVWKNKNGRARKAESESQGLCGTATVRGERRDTEDVQSLKLMMESLRTQLTSHAHLCREHKAAFEAERHVLRQEKEVVIQRNTQEVRRLSQQVKEIEEVLQGKLEQILGLQKKVRHLEGQLASHHDSVPPSSLLGQSATLPSRSRSHHNLADQSGNMQKQINDLKAKLQEARSQAENYKSQVLSLEAQLCQERENMLSLQESHQVRSKAMKEEVTLLRKKYEELDRRRRLESEGFRRDIADLRKQLVKVESQLVKAIVVGAADVDREDHAIQALLASAQRARQLQAQILRAVTIAVFKTSMHRPELSIVYRCIGWGREDSIFSHRDQRADLYPASIISRCGRKSNLAKSGGRTGKARSHILGRKAACCLGKLEYRRGSI
ncbi:unnamed protein product [Darwinula stevensoni]|uniref:Uncharacterized protein n=1 Tax=Darwinula stevensoni TaxID=69355 RepID=A0A7R8X5M0_9CRUS|nr:unnamed protein product [Darwinula stevensoni]CAG0886766.1 unnamed protein product [Darwinula stevensoni]